MAEQDFAALTARIDAMEARVRAAEDQLEIVRLLNTYGPLVDSAEGEAAAELWVEGGHYRFLHDGKLHGLEAPDELAAMYGWPGHIDLVNTGVSHFTGMPQITLNGDEAKAVGYSYVMLKDGDQWKVWRGAVNSWQLRRTDKGWRIVERVSLPLDGSERSHNKMREVMAG